MLPIAIKNEIIKSLKQIDPDRVVLFGSYAYGTPGADSDIDLYVVTKDENLPGSFSEKMDLKIKVADLLSELRTKIAIDLIVHTRPMHKRFEEIGSSFFQEIEKQGVRLM